MRNIENFDTNNKIEAYVSYSNQKDMQKALSSLTNAVNEYTGISRGSSLNLPFDPSSAGGTRMRGRHGLTHEGYEAWRPSEATRTSDVKTTMVYSDMCYKDHGLIKNVIDLMGDFGSQGIRLVHPNKRIETFYQNWFIKVGGIERSERFLNIIYRLGNLVARRHTAKINKSAEQKIYRGFAKEDLVAEFNSVNKREIPWSYTFLHPATVDVVGGKLSNFIGGPKEYSINVPLNIQNLIKNPKGKAEQEVVNKIPDEIKQAALLNKPIKLPSDKIRVFHYKKDDWQEWAFPIISSIALDISLYEKLKLADRAALDGAISNLRIISLGSLEHKILPTEVAVQQLAEILSSNTNAGTLDLIWGPDIKLIESKTDVHKFLGQEKYVPTLMAIYAGLGIPPTLTGTFGASGTTNNFVSLKTLTQRLEYGRDLLVQFWNEEIRIVQQAMGFRFPATVEFGMMNLGDETAEKALLIQLSDRNLISDELLQRHFNADNEMERIRTVREDNERGKGKRLEKAGPFYETQIDNALKKIFSQSGVVTPSEVGVELLPKKKGEVSALQSKMTKVNETKKGVPQQGRPINSKDTKKRKQKEFKPKVKASVMIWSKSAQEELTSGMYSFLLNHFDKPNLRSLTAEETVLAEKIQFGVLCNMKPYTEINDSSIYEALNKPFVNGIFKLYTDLKNEVSNEIGESLNVEQKKHIKSYIYSLINNGE